MVFSKKLNKNHTLLQWFLLQLELFMIPSTAICRQPTTDTGSTPNPPQKASTGENRGPPLVGFLADPLPGSPRAALIQVENFTLTRHGLLDGTRQRQHPIVMEPPPAMALYHPCHGHLPATHV
ncbi:hypothetical protein VZT92_022911 [Zoarces viviparus]|uniref:Secreted protein n=1 Tax=Zoarces viviparus TaxID=48416 RepID=A0AAW1E5W3_ZOAVI